MQKVSILLVFTSFSLVLLLGACKDSPAPWKKRISLYRKIKNYRKKEGTTIKISKKEHSLFSKKFDWVEWQSPKRSFYVAKRWMYMGSIRCALCHLPRLPKRLLIKINKSHSKVTMQHGPKGFHQCKTCHDPDKMNTLRTPTGKVVSFDQSYLICATCHVQQARDWAGGAHGKRLKTWRGVRAIQSCTACHNPHAPKLGKTLPKMYELSQNNARKEKK